MACRCLRTNGLLLATIMSVVLGAVVGGLCRQLNLTPETIQLIGFPGEIFMRMLKMLILPLIVASMITGIANVDRKSSGKMGLVTMGYYITSTVISLLVGVMLVFTIRPGLMGTTVSSVPPATPARSPTPGQVVLDLVRNMFPDNMVRAAFQSTRTVFERLPRQIASSNKTLNTSTDLRNGEEWVGKLTHQPGLNAIGMLLYCAVFGVMLGRLGDSGKHMLGFFNTLNNVTMKMVSIVMWFSPVGILFLILGKILEVDDLAGTARHLGIYMVTGLTGTIIHMFLVVPLLYLLVTRRNAYRVLRGVVQALVTALATESSSATLPVSIRCCEVNLKVHKTITRFVLPIGATINMDGSAMINCISAVYVAQLNGIHLGFAGVLNLCLLNIMASIGITGVPGSGVPTLVMILTSAGLPIHDIPLLLAVDWFMSRIATVTNVCGDCMAASCVQHFLKPFTDDQSRTDRAPANGSLVHEYETV